jgi:hypothetical protein
MDRFDPVARVRELTEASDRIGSNLLELESNATVALLDAADLSGETGDRWDAARRTLDGLFTAHASLKDVIEQARPLAGRGWLLSGLKLDELRTVLDGASIVVADTTMRLAERDLLSNSRVVVRQTADELIAEMSASYAEVKSVVVGVATVWDALIPRLRCERQRFLELTRSADDVGLHLPGLAAAERTLRDVSESVLSDPLAVDLACLDSIVAAFDFADLELAEFRSLPESCADRVDAARALLDEAQRLIADCGEAVRRVSSRIVLREPLEVVALPSGITEWFDRFERDANETGEASAGELIAWNRRLDQVVGEVHAVSTRCRLLFAEREDLRARLSAYLAKAERLGALEDNVLDRTYEEARSALYTAPSDLDVAHDLVRRYQQQLSTRARL